jgi:hypothetical protein
MWGTCTCADARTVRIKSGRHCMTDGSQLELEALADAYLRHHALNAKEDQWAFGRVMDMCRDEPQQVLCLTLLLISKAGNDDRVLAYVAAGPLEDILSGHGLAVIDRIERESEGNVRLQLALSGVWGLEGTAVHERWLSLMKRWGFADGTRQCL